MPTDEETFAALWQVAEAARECAGAYDYMLKGGENYGIRTDASFRALRSALEKLPKETP